MDNLIRCGRSCMINLTEVYDIQWGESTDGLFIVTVEYPRSIKTYCLDENEFETFILELNYIKEFNGMKP